MKTFLVGNVVKLKSGSIVIVSGVRDNLTSWISFDSTNCSGYTRNDTHMRGTACFCIENNGGEYDTECEDCKGSGSYLEEISGMDKAVLLEDNVKKYIIKSLTKNFNF